MLSTDGVTGGMKRISFGRFKMGKKGLLKSNFTINPPVTLFGPDWSQLKKGMCPHCAHRLYIMPSKPGFLRCKSKLHKGFVIHTSKIDELIPKV